MGRQRRSRGRNVNGILLFDKPLGISSNDALQRVKRLFKAQKAGHTGSLDPLADGLLPLCFGAATKLSAYLLDADKHYWVRVKLGVTTTTADAEGEVLQTRPTDAVTEAALHAVLPQFTGEIDQLPPMYSALKHKGQRLYKLAREGIEVEREPRRIRVHSLELVKVELPEFELQVALLERHLCPHSGRGHRQRAGLRGARDRVAPHRRRSLWRRQHDHPGSSSNRSPTNRARPLWIALLLPLDSALGDWPEVRLSDDAAHYLQMGQAVLVPKAPTEGWVRLYDNKRVFIGVGEVEDDGRIAPRRLMTQVTARGK